MMEKDAEMTEDVVAYNIIPIDCPTTTNDIVSFSEVNTILSFTTININTIFFFFQLPKKHICFHFLLISGKSSNLSSPVL